MAWCKTRFSCSGRDIKTLKEIDQRKIGRDPETDKFNEELQEVLNREYKELDNFIISYSSKEIETVPVKPAIKPEHIPKPEVKPTPTIQSQTSQSIKSEIPAAAEYDSKTVEIKSAKAPPPVMEKKPIIEKKQIIEKKPTIEEKVISTPKTPSQTSQA